MKKTIFLFAFLFFAGFALNSQINGDISFGSDSTLDVMTWNIENFPKNSNTVNYVSQIITGLHVDIIALQEIYTASSFDQILTNTGYSGHMTTASYKDLAFIYNPLVIKNVVFSEILTGYNCFTSNPLLMQFDYNNIHYYIIDTHLKCCGDDYLDYNNENDEETRRYLSCNLLKQYIDINLPSKKVMVVGDMNDALTDPTIKNVFQNILADSNNYEFADMGINQGPSSEWSHPASGGYPDIHFDHLLVTNELFDEINDSASLIKTQKIEDHLTDGWSEYKNIISDHRPVAIRMRTQPLLVENVKKTNFYVYPNPATDQVTFNFEASQNSQIEIFNSLGQKITTLIIKNNQNQTIWDVSELQNGVYFAKINNESTSQQSKIIINR